jgi:hypothetical protein
MKINGQIYIWSYFHEKSDTFDIVILKYDMGAKACRHTSTLPRLTLGDTIEM